MPNIKHTPGPWRLETDSSFTKGRHLITDSGGFPRAEVYSAHFSTDRTRAEALANAKLIAAAPDLLQFIENWREVICGGDALPQLEGWARKFNTEALALISKAKN
jgi:hypothetical protein